MTIQYHFLIQKPSDVICTGAHGCEPGFLINRYLSVLFRCLGVFKYTYHSKSLTPVTDGGDDGDNGDVCGDYGDMVKMLVVMVNERNRHCSCGYGRINGIVERIF